MVLRVTGKPTLSLPSPRQPRLIRARRAIARPEHWFKNIFMLPGAALALALADESLAPELAHLLLGVVSTCLIVSANYTINEWLDAESDRHHPAKQHRPSAAGRLSSRLVYLQWGALALAGLALASAIPPISWCLPPPFW